MKSGTRGIIKTCGHNDQFITGFTIKPKVYGPSLRSADYRRPSTILIFSDVLILNLYALVRPRTHYDLDVLRRPELDMSSDLEKT